MASILFKEEQGSFLVGVVAAKQTKTNKIGFIGGVESPLIKKFENGFKAGVKSVNPDAEVISQYAESFNSPEKAQLSLLPFTAKALILFIKRLAVLETAYLQKLKPFKRR